MLHLSGDRGLRAQDEFPSDGAWESEWVSLPAVPCLQSRLHSMWGRSRGSTSTVSILLAAKGVPQTATGSLGFHLLKGFVEVGSVPTNSGMAISLKFGRGTYEVTFVTKLHRKTCCDYAYTTETHVKSPGPSSHVLRLSILAGWASQVVSCLFLFRNTPLINKLAATEETSSEFFTVIELLLCYIGRSDINLHQRTKFGLDCAWVRLLLKFLLNDIAVCGGALW